MYSDIGLKHEIGIVKHLGCLIGYGNLMQLASTLWANDLENKGLPRSGAHSPSVFSLMTEEGKQVAIDADNLYRTLIKQAEEVSE